MEKALNRKGWFRLQYAAICLALLFIVLLYDLRTFDRVAFSIQEYRHAQEWKNNSLWLPDYQLAREITIPGIENNLSGLTWNNDTQTLFAAVNDPPLLFELSPSGEILRRIALPGFEDTETVEYVGDNQFIIGEEKKRNLVLATIDDATSEIRPDGLPHLALDIPGHGNWGLESVAWDGVHRKLYAAKERFPVIVREITGFPPQSGVPAQPVRDRDDEAIDRQLFVADIAGLDFVPGRSHLLVLSEASKLIVEVDGEGKPISSLSLLSGHGMTGLAPQPEGIALGGDGTLYVVSEPNLLYVFRKP